MLKLEKKIIEDLDNILEVTERAKDNLVNYGFKKENSELKTQTFRSIYDYFGGLVQDWATNVNQCCQYYEQSKEDFEEETKNDK